MFAVNLAFSFGMGLYGFVMPAYARELGATPRQFGAILSGAFALGTIAVIPGGLWADRYDRRTLMLIGWAMCLPAPLIFAWADTWTWLIPGYVFFFLSFFCNPAISAYVAETAGAARSGSVWGTINAAFPLGFIFGPTLGGLLIRAAGIRAVFLCTFVCYLASFLLLWTMSPQSTRVRVGGAESAGPRGEHPRSPRTAGNSPPRPQAVAVKGLRSPVYRALARVGLLFAFFHLLSGVGPTYISLYLQDTLGLDLSRISVFGSAGALGGFLCAPLIGQLRDRRGAKMAMGVALALVVLSNAGLLVLRSLVPLFLVLMMRGGENGVFTLGQTEIASRAPREEMGRVFAGFHVMTGIGGTIGPYVGGALYGVDPRLPFLAVIAGAAVLWRAARRVLPQPDASAASRAAGDPLRPAPVPAPAGPHDTAPSCSPAGPEGPEGAGSPAGEVEDIV